MPRRSGLAVVLAALLLGGCSQASVPAPSPPPPAEALSAPTQVRWAWSALSFHDENRGWAALTTQEPTGESTLFHTADGGGTWTRTGAPAMFVESLQFADDRRGVAVGAAYGCREKGQGCSVLVATTGDGGGTWEIRYRHPLAESLSSTPPTLSMKAEGMGYALYVGSGESLLLTTADGGATWTRAPAPAAGWAYQSAAFAGPQNGWAHARKCAMVGEQEQCRYAIFATTSGGRHWRHQFDLPSGRRLWPGNIFFADDRQGWLYPSAPASTCTMLGCAGPIYRTVDGGQSWVEINWASPSAVGFPLQISFADRTRGWMLLDRGIGISADGGTTWTRTPLPAGIAELQLLSAPSANVAWAVGSAGPGRPGVLLRTIDGGATWAQVPAPPAQ